jgi:hypothetical protein
VLPVRSLPTDCPNPVDSCRLTSTSGESDPNRLAQCCHGVGSQSRVPLQIIADAACRIRIPPSPQRTVTAPLRRRAMTENLGRDENLLCPESMPSTALARRRCATGQRGSSPGARSAGAHTANQSNDQSDRRPREHALGEDRGRAGEAEHPRVGAAHWRGVARHRLAPQPSRLRRGVLEHHAEDEEQCTRTSELTRRWS